MGMEEWLNKYPPQDKDKKPGNEKPNPVGRKKLIRMPVQQSLDLHGLTVEETEIEVENFLLQSKRAGLKKVLIIHGKGHHSAGKPVLKIEVLKLLEKSPIAGEFGTADRKDGGSGAVWVLLK